MQPLTDMGLRFFLHNLSPDPGPPGDPMPPSFPEPDPDRDVPIDPPGAPQTAATAC
jgi:hypothetical protein